MAMSITGLSHAKYFTSIYGPKLHQFAVQLESLNNASFCMSSAQRETLVELFNVLSDFASQDPSLRSFVSYPSTLTNDLLKCLLCYYRSNDTSVRHIDEPFFQLLAANAIDTSVIDMLFSYCSSLQYMSSSSEGQAFCERYLATLLQVAMSHPNKRKLYTAAVKEFLLPSLRLYSSHYTTIESLFRQCFFPEDAGFLEDICSQALPAVDGTATKSSKGSFHHDLFATLRTELQNEAVVYAKALQALVKTFGAASKACVGDSTASHASAQHAFATAHRSHIRRLLHFALTLIYLSSSSTYHFAIRSQLQMLLAVEGALPTHASLASYLAQLQHQAKLLVSQLTKSPACEDILSMGLLLDIDHRVVTEQLTDVLSTLARISDDKCNDAMVQLMTGLIQVFNSMRRLDHLMAQLLQLSRVGSTLLYSLRHKAVQQLLFSAFSAMATPLWMSCWQVIVAGCSAVSAVSCLCVPVASAYRASVDAEFMVSLFSSLDTFFSEVVSIGVSAKTLRMLEAASVLLSRHYTAYQYTHAFSITVAQDNSEENTEEETPDVTSDNVAELWGKLLENLDTILFSREFTEIRKCDSAELCLSVLRVLFNTLELSVEREDCTVLIRSVTACISSYANMHVFQNVEVASFIFEHVLYWASLQVPIADIVSPCVASVLTLSSAPTLLVSETIRENQNIMNAVCDAVVEHLPLETACQSLMACPNTSWVRNSMCTSVLTRCLSLIDRNASDSLCKLMIHAMVTHVNAASKDDESKSELAGIFSSYKGEPLVDVLPCGDIGDALIMLCVDIIVCIADVKLQDVGMNVVFGKRCSELSGIVRLVKLSVESSRKCCFQSVVNAVCDTQHQWVLSPEGMSCIETMLCIGDMNTCDTLQSTLRLISILELSPSRTLLNAVTQALSISSENWWQLAGVAMTVFGIGDAGISQSAVISMIVQHLNNECDAEDIFYSVQQFCKCSNNAAIAALVTALTSISVNCVSSGNVLLVCDALVAHVTKHAAIVPAVLRIVIDTVQHGSAQDMPAFFCRALKLLCRLLARDTSKKRKRSDDNGHENVIIQAGMTVLTAVGSYAQQVHFSALLASPYVLKTALTLFHSMISASTGEHATLVVSVVSQSLRQWLTLLLRIAGDISPTLADAYSACCSVYGRILLSFCSNTNYRKHSPVLVSLLMEVIVAAGGSSTYLSSDFKNHIMPGIYGLFDTLFLIKQRKEVTLILPPFCRPLFNELYSTYEQDFKFIGKS